jgi:hypothetical protein
LLLLLVLQNPCSSNNRLLLKLLLLPAKLICRWRRVALLDAYDRRWRQKLIGACNYTRTQLL